jgi:hypothetical protein
MVGLGSLNGLRFSKAISYGNARIDLGGLMDIVRRYRPKVEGRAIRYTHCTGLASEDSKQRNQELLIIGRMA